MKIQSLKPLRTNFNFPVTFTHQNMKSMRGRTRFVSRLEQMTGAINYSPRVNQSNIRMTNIKRVSANGKPPVYHAVGVGNIEGAFNRIKSILKSNGFTGARMGGLIIRL